MPIRCKYEEFKCSRDAYYNYPEEKRKYCKEHKKEGMKNVKKDNRICVKCIERGVEKKASYNYLEEKRPKYCKEHSERDMINICNKKKIKRCESCKICKIKKYNLK